jgi:hypothetical protein
LSSCFFIAALYRRKVEAGIQYFTHVAVAGVLVEHLQRGLDESEVRAQARRPPMRPWGARPAECAFRPRAARETWSLASDPIRARFFSRSTGAYNAA